MFGAFKPQDPFIKKIADTKLALTLIGLEIKSENEYDPKVGEKTFVFKHDHDDVVDVTLHLIEHDECLYCVNFTNKENGDFTANSAVYKLVDAVVTIMYGINMAKLTNTK